MALRAIFGRRWVHSLGLAGAAAAGYAFGLAADRAGAQAPAAPSPNRNVVAYIYGSTPITRCDLGDFLIARGGYEKLDLLVNKKIIEVEAARRNVSVTPEEVESGLNDDLRGLGVDKKDFVKHVLPRYGKTLFEWTEDVIKPRLLLGKMCRDRVKITPEDLQRAFENKYGEKRQAKLICWNESDKKAALKQWEEARKGEVAFDAVARTQADPNLAASCGLVAPVGRYSFVDAEGRNDAVEKALFTLKKGEMSQLIGTPAGIMCVKCVAILEPDKTVEFEKVKAALEKDVFDKKLSNEVPKFFTTLKELAKPNVLLVGPPGPREFRDGTQHLLQTGGIAAPGAPAPAPMPKP